MKTLGAGLASNQRQALSKKLVKVRTFAEFYGLIKTRSLAELEQVVDALEKSYERMAAELLSDCAALSAEKEILEEFRQQWMLWEECPPIQIAGYSISDSDLLEIRDTVLKAWKYFAERDKWDAQADATFMAGRAYMMEVQQQGTSTMVIPELDMSIPSAADTIVNQWAWEGTPARTEQRAPFLAYLFFPFSGRYFPLLLRPRLARAVALQWHNMRMCSNYDQCGHVFIAKRSDQKYCLTDECRKYGLRNRQKDYYDRQKAKRQQKKAKRTTQR